MKSAILLVEDDIDIRENFKLLLESEGFEVLQARNGKVALDGLKASPALPALIILDLMMPIMDGLQFRKLQLEDPRLAGVPVIIMTAGGNVEAKAASLGAQGFIKKPIEVEAALGVVSKLLLSAAS